LSVVEKAPPERASTDEAFVETLEGDDARTGEFFQTRPCDPCGSGRS
jgi:hypothetical protein